MGHCGILCLSACSASDDWYIVVPVGFEPTLPRFSYLLQLSLLIVYINIAQSFVVWTLPLPCWYYTNLGIPCQVSTPFIWSNL